MASCVPNMKNETRTFNGSCICIRINKLVKKCEVSYIDNHISAKGLCSKLDTPIVMHGISPKTYNDTIIKIEFVRVGDWQFFDSIKNSVIFYKYDKKSKINCSNAPLPNGVNASSN